MQQICLANHVCQIVNSITCKAKVFLLSACACYLILVFVTMKVIFFFTKNSQILGKHVFTIRANCDALEEGEKELSARISNEVKPKLHVAAIIQINQTKYSLKEII